MWGEVIVLQMVCTFNSGVLSNTQTYTCCKNLEGNLGEDAATLGGQWNLDYKNASLSSSIVLQQWLNILSTSKTNDSQIPKQSFLCPRLCLFVTERKIHTFIFSNIFPKYWTAEVISLIVQKHITLMVPLGTVHYESPFLRTWSLSAQLQRTPEPAELGAKFPKPCSPRKTNGSLFGLVVVFAYLLRRRTNITT